MNTFALHSQMMLYQFYLIRHYLTLTFFSLLCNLLPGTFCLVLLYFYAVIYISCSPAFYMALYFHLAVGMRSGPFHSANQSSFCPGPSRPSGRPETNWGLAFTEDDPVIEMPQEGNGSRSTKRAATSSLQESQPGRLCFFLFFF